ncbi:MAG: hypothetical protein A2234_01145 [Elusimicrobia bacterium RIFOXYA2_FULL_58_8]|nr:MAG: hypothetical protein A2285_07530 [Elusimicrobia bacterium RIFOXYA12_FULL_57_11]OGS16968.1 MAG: hypothetical protein A2234_01145 [Elusimicrobia bacterium RIFOXYA2_FULL_58_8]
MPYPTALSRKVRTDLIKFTDILRANGYNWDVMGLNPLFTPDKKLSLLQIKEHWRRFLTARHPGGPAKNHIYFQLYIPFCRSKCSYCHYRSIMPIPAKGEIDAYIEHLLWAFKFFSPVFKGKSFSRLYIGGGTANLLSSLQLEKLLGGLFKNFSFSANGRKTFQHNPNTASFSNFRVLRKFGFNSLSFGVQSIHPSVLRLNNRYYQDGGSALQAIARAKEAGFDDINVDLIAGLAGDDIDGFKKSFSRLIKLLPYNITVHGLIPDVDYLAEKLKMDSRRYFTRHYPGLIKKLLPFMLDLSARSGYLPDSSDPFRWQWDFRSNKQLSIGPGPECEVDDEYFDCVFGLGLFSKSYIPKVMEYRQVSLPANNDPSGKVYAARRYAAKEAMVRFVVGKFARENKISMQEFTRIFGMKLEEAFPYALRALEFLEAVSRENEFYVFNFNKPEHRYLYALFFSYEQQQPGKKTGHSFLK